MIKKLADTLFRIAYGKTVASHDEDVHVEGYERGYKDGQALAEEEREEIRREWLTKGHERGQTSNRTGCPFSLYLTRSDLAPDQQHSAIGVQHTNGPVYRWWGCVDMTTGAEVNLGTVDVMGSPQQALAAYLKYLPDDMRVLAGVPPMQEVGPGSGVENGK